MKSYLIIRLPEHADQPVHWQSWPEQVDVADSHGSLDNISQLGILSEKARDTTVIVLVPAAHVTLHQLTVTGKITSAVLQSLPWRLEEELSEDVDNLHFTVLYQQKRNGDEGDEGDENDSTLISLALVANSQMLLWQSWLEQAALRSHQWLPDALALPCETDTCTLTAINDDILFKHGHSSLSFGHFGHCDPLWLSFYLKHLQANNEDITIKSLSPIKHSLITPVIPTSTSPLSPLAPLAPVAVTQSTNLLHGRWQQTSPWLMQLKPWRKVAALVAVILILSGIQSVFHTYQLEEKAATLNTESTAIYQQLFPGERIQSVAAQMRQKLAALQGSSQQTNGLLDTMTDLQPVFTGFTQLKPVTLQYERRQNTLRIEAQAKDFETFTRFRDQSSKKLNGEYTITLDAVERSDKNTVTGILVISGKTV